jgi:hypothetical protein
MAFAAQLEHVPRVAWLFVIANMLWVTVYDTIYAMVDRDDDSRSAFAPPRFCSATRTGTSSRCCRR